MWVFLGTLTCPPFELRLYAVDLSYSGRVNNSVIFKSLEIISLPLVCAKWYHFMDNNTRERLSPKSDLMLGSVDMMVSFFFAGASAFDLRYKTLLPLHS